MSKNTIPTLSIMVLIVSLLSPGSSCESNRLDDLDNGMMIRPGPDGEEIVLHVCDSLLKISSNDEEIDVEEAATRWNDWLGIEVVVTDDYTNSIGISIEFGYVDGDLSEGDEAGVAEIHYDETGCILFADIVISYDIGYDEDIVSQVLAHEIGHCFGLADDPGPPTTVDLRSIMSVPIDPIGVLTSHDRDLILEYF